MNAYQRGNRHGLLNLAATLEERAAAEQGRREKIEGSATYKLGRYGAIQLAETASLRQEAYEAAAGVARRLSEALPEDPEDYLGEEDSQEEEGDSPMPDREAIVRWANGLDLPSSREKVAVRRTCPLHGEFSTRHPVSEIPTEAPCPTCRALCP